MKANAVVFTRPNEVVFRAVECPAPGPKDAVVRLLHSWISIGTEGSYLRGERIGGDTPWQTGDPAPFPIVPGYQGVGVVETIGASVNGLSPGQHVFCVCGKVNGMFQPVGGHISPLVAPAEEVRVLPAGVEPLSFAPLVLAQVGYNCGSRAPIEAGEAAIVIGDGLVGQWSAQTLQWRGAKVAMVGRHDARLKQAAKLADCYAINQRQDDWVAAVREFAPGGAAVAVDTVGSVEVTCTLMTLLRRRGHVVSAGFCAGDDRVSLQALRDSELSLDSVSGLAPDRMQRTFELIAGGALQTLPLITHHLRACDAATAWEMIRTRRDEVLGVVLDW